jgi:uncharacterized protein
MNHLINELALLVGGLIAGILAGLLGSGGGFLTVPLMLAFNYSPIQTIGTTGLAVSITAISGSIQNSYMGYFSLKRVLSIGIPALVATQVSVHIANKIEPYVLLAVCGVLMLLMIYLVELRRQLIERAKQVTTESVTEAPATEEPVEPVKSLTPIKPIAIVGDYRKTVPSLFDQQIRRIAYADKPTVYAVEEPTVHSKRSLPHWLTSLTARRMTVGSLAGLFAGMVGGGAGSLLVPMQMLLLGETIKVAIQTSIGVNIITSTSSWINHASRGNVLFAEGFMLAIGGFVGAQIGTRFLPKLPDRFVKVAFNTMIVLLATYILWKAWKSYSG